MALLSSFECQPEQLSSLFKKDSSLSEFIETHVKPKVQKQTFSTDPKNLTLVYNLLDYCMAYKENFQEALRASLNLIQYFDDKKELIMKSFKEDSMMEDLTKFIIDQAKNVTSCDDKNPDHKLFVTWMAVCFSVRDDSKFVNSFERMTSNMLHLHGYNGNKITECIEMEEIFSSEVELPIICHLRSKLPALESFGNSSGWMKENFLINVMGLLSFLIYCSDWGTDMQQNVNFFNGYKNTNPTKSCTIGK